MSNYDYYSSSKELRLSSAHASETLVLLSLVIDCRLMMKELRWSAPPHPSFGGLRWSSLSSFVAGSETPPFAFPVEPSTFFVSSPNGGFFFVSTPVWGTGFFVSPLPPG
jgi:hypothetical protein